MHLFIDSCISARGFFFSCYEKGVNCTASSDHVTVCECVASTKSWQPATWHRNLISVLQCASSQTCDVKLHVRIHVCFAVEMRTTWAFVLCDSSAHTPAPNQYFGPVFTPHSREAKGDQRASLLTAQANSNNPPWHFQELANMHSNKKWKQ